MANIKVAKPTKQDFDICHRFNSVMKQLTDNRMYRCADEADWQEWDEDDEDFKVLSEIRDEYCEYADKDKDDLDNDDHQQILWRYVKWFFNNHPSSLGRVIMCADIAMDNAFDKSDEVDTIEWNKRCDEALERYDREEILKSLPVTKEILEANGFEYDERFRYYTDKWTLIKFQDNGDVDIVEYDMDGNEYSLCTLKSVLDFEKAMQLRTDGWTLKTPEQLSKE